MGYQMPIVCKEMYLPISANIENISLDQYKELYGVNLSQYIYLDMDNKAIRFDYPLNTKVYIALTDSGTYSLRVLNININDSVNYESGVTTAETFLGEVFLPKNGNFDNATSCGILLKIDKDSDFKKENVLVSYFEY